MVHLMKSFMVKQFLNTSSRRPLEGRKRTPR
jgi:hypothetical protein